MSAARYYQRSPRYVFRPDDKSLMRFAGMDTKNVAAQANVRDLSETGLSFTIEGDSAPFENELLKIEFAVPGEGPKGRQIAWFATVVRVETRSNWNPETGDQKETLIALRFRQLPPPFQKAIQDSLGGKTNEEENIVNHSPDWSGDWVRQFSFVGLRLHCSCHSTG